MSRIYKGSNGDLMYRTVCMSAWRYWGKLRRN